MNWKEISQKQANDFCESHPGGWEAGRRKLNEMVVKAWNDPRVGLFDGSIHISLKCKCQDTTVKLSILAGEVGRQLERDGKISALGCPHCVES